MKAEKIEKLSFLVTSIVEELHQLKTENQKLNERILELDQQYQAAHAVQEQAEKELGVLGNLRAMNQKMEKDQTLIRAKVQTILNDLKQMDCS